VLQKPISMLLSDCPVTNGFEFYYRRPALCQGTVLARLRYHFYKFFHLTGNLEDTLLLLLLSAAIGESYSLCQLSGLRSLSPVVKY